MSAYVSCTACHNVQPEGELIHGRFCSYCHGTSFSAATESEYEERLEFTVPAPIAVRPVSTEALELEAMKVLARMTEEMT